MRVITPEGERKYALATITHALTALVKAYREDNGPLEVAAGFRDESTGDRGRKQRS